MYMQKNMLIEIKNNKIEVISFLKGFSILTIVFMHLIQGYITKIPSFISIASSIGGTGVHVFFFCSGFGLYLSYIRKKTTFIQFIKKRFKKIYIPYILIVFISFFIPCMYEYNDRISALLSHIFLHKMFIPKYEESFGGHFWFISTIIQFYLLFIPLCKIREKIPKKRYFILGSLLISIIWWFIVYFNGIINIRIWNSFCLQYLWEFTLGMHMAEYIHVHKKIKLNKFILFIIATIGIGLQASMALSSGFLKVFNDIPALFGYGSLALLLYNISSIKKMSIKITEYSYELYLIHILIIEIIFKLLNPTNISLQILLGLFSIIVCIFIAKLYALFINKIIYRNNY